MPLSEHEQRLLEQIEQSLYAEDPKFARSWRAKDPRSVRRNTVVRAAFVFVVGLAGLLAGVIVLNSATVLGIALGAGGFVLMLGAAWYGLSTRQRLRAVPPTGGPSARRTGTARPRRSLSARLEERWERRQDEGRR